MVHAISLDGDSGAYIFRNVIRDTYSYSIFIHGASDSIVARNHISGSRTTDAIKLGEGTLTGNVIRENYLHHNARDGIDRATRDDVPSCELFASNTFAGNVIYDNGLNGIEIKPADPCKYSAPIGDNTFAHNLVVRNQESGLALMRSRVSGNGELSTPITNSILCGNGGASILLNDAQDISLNGNWIRGSGPPPDTPVLCTGASLCRQGWLDGTGIALWTSTRRVSVAGNGWEVGDCGVATLSECPSAGSNDPADAASLAARLAEILAAYPYHAEDNDGDGYMNWEV